MTKVYYITVDNIDPSFLGFHGGRIETKFIDILAADGFTLKKHFTSSVFPWESFFSLVTGVSNPDENDGSLISLTGRDVGGVALTNKREVKTLDKKFEDCLDVFPHPSDLATTVLKYIKDDKCGLVHAHYTLPENNENCVVKMDAAVGKLLAAIEEFGDYNEACVIFTAFSGVGCKPSACVLKLPESKTYRFYAAFKKVNFVTRDVDFLPTLFDLHEEYYRLPHNIDGTTIVNNLMGKDQKLYAIHRPVLIDHTGEVLLKCEP